MIMCNDVKTPKWSRVRQILSLSVLSVEVKSLSWTTKLAVDGQFQYDLKQGCVAKCWLHLATLYDGQPMS